jgi:hypothetical protein
VGPAGFGPLFMNHNNLPLKWAIIGGPSGLAIDNRTGNFTLVAPGMSYAEACASAGGTCAVGVPAALPVYISLFDARNPAFGGIAVVTINVVDMNNPPVMANYSFRVVPGDVVLGARLNPLENGGTMDNTDPDINPAWMPMDVRITGVSTCRQALDASGLFPITSCSPYANGMNVFSIEPPPSPPPYTPVLRFSSGVTQEDLESSTGLRTGSVFAFTGGGAVFLCSEVFRVDITTTDGGGMFFRSSALVMILSTNVSTTVQLSSVSPSSYLDTAGGALGVSSAGAILTIAVSGFSAGTLDLNVTVGALGTSMGQQNCPLVTSSDPLTATLVDRTAPGWASAYLSSFPSPLTSPPPIDPLGSSNWNLRCLLPPGEGAAPVSIKFTLSAAPGIVLWSGETNAPIILYSPPVIEGVSEWTRTGQGTGTLAMAGPPPCNVPPSPGQACAALAPPPALFDSAGALDTTTRTARLEGAFFGRCPYITVDNSDSLPPVVVRTCVAGSSPGARAPDVVVGYAAPKYFIEFPMPPGVGAGRGDDGAGRGWSVAVTAGDTLSVPPGQNRDLYPIPPGAQASAPVSLRYLPAVPIGVSTVSGGTQGGDAVQLAADFLGPLGAPLPCVQLLLGVPPAPLLYFPPPAGPTANITTCTVAPLNSMCSARADSLALSCTVPEGSGANLQVSVRHDAATAGLGGSFSYTPPVVDRICVTTLLAPAGAPYPVGPAPLFAAPAASACATFGGPPLTLPALPDNSTVVVITGTSLGPPSVSNCAFTAWLAALQPCAAAGTPACVQAAAAADSTEDPAPCCRVTAGGATDYGAQGPLTCASADARGAAVSMEDWLGEGQVPPSDVLWWSHTLVVLQAPPGVGSRLATVRVGGQAPTLWPRDTAPNAVYARPQITGALAPLTNGSGSTLGGGSVFIPAANHPRLPYARWLAKNVSRQLAAGANASTITPLPNQLFGAPFEPYAIPFARYAPPGELGFQAPTETLVVVVGTHCLAALTDGVANAPVSSLAQCTAGGVTDSTAAGVTFTVPPGVGKNKPVVIGVASLADNGQPAFQVVSNTGTFSYDPPQITQIGTMDAVTLTISRVVLAHPAAAASVGISVVGLNFGAPVYFGPGRWTEDELKLGVTIGATPCSVPGRADSPNPAIGNYVFCTFPGSDLGQLSVGYSNASIVVAGQVGTLPSGSANSLYVACQGGNGVPTSVTSYGTAASGAFGFVGEKCWTCPLGAACPGFQQDPPSPNPPPSAGPPPPNPCFLGAAQFRAVPPCFVTERRTNITTGPPLDSRACCLDRAFTDSQRAMVNKVVRFLPLDAPGPRSGDVVSAYPVRAGRLQFDGIAGGYHSYPIPGPGFFNLNSTNGMWEACPDQMRPLVAVGGGAAQFACPGPANNGAHCDACIVACVPPEACLGDNVCAPAYRSLPPTFRCSSCNEGFYSLNGKCTPCPQSPWAVVVGILLAILLLGWAGWFLNKYNVNIGLISIGVDFFQTLAIASNANVPWPKELRDLFLIFSAFNLNIEIVAPECFIKSVTFVSKFQAIIGIPLLLYFVFFVLSGTSFLYRRLVMGQRDWRLLTQDAPPMFSGGLLMLYLWYLYVAKTTMVRAPPLPLKFTPLFSR